MKNWLGNFLIKSELDADEKIEIEGPPNLFRGTGGVSGKIFLTDKKLVFKSHKINVQKGQTNIEYKNIKEIIRRKTTKIVNNGIRINENKDFDFVVNERNLWLKKINKRIESNLRRV